jgi:hypothetical protein
MAKQNRSGKKIKKGTKLGTVQSPAIVHNHNEVLLHG